MGTLKDEDVLRAEIAAADIKIKVGGVYQHYKGAHKTYKVLDFATLEATDELCVVYQALYGAKFKFVRPVSIWLETVEWEGKKLPRFRLLEPAAE